jgi:hypothetical protein
MYDRFKDPPYVYTRDSVANTTVRGLRPSVLSLSSDRRELWEERKALREELAAIKTRLATCEKVILDSVLSKTPPTP